MTIKTSTKWQEWQRVMLRDECQRYLKGGMLVDWYVVSNLVGKPIVACQSMWHYFNKGQKISAQIIPLPKRPPYTNAEIHEFMRGVNYEREFHARAE